MKETKKQHAFAVDRDERNKRRRALRHVEHTHYMVHQDGQQLENEREFETCAEHAEDRQIVAEMTHSFVSTINFYKSEYGGARPHDEAVKEALALDESRRQWVEGLEPEKVDWRHIAAVGEHSMSDALALWTRVREAADDELETGRRAAKVAGNNIEAYALAQFLALRDSFADQWQPQGGIESAMIDMLAVAFSRRA